MKEHFFKNEAEWLEGRRGLGIGASEAAMLMLPDARFGSPFKLWHEKLGLRVDEGRYKKEREFGLLFEPTIATLFERDAEPHRAVIGLPPHTIYQSDEYPYMIATLDRLQRHPDFADPLPLELKTAHWNLRGDWQSEPPVEYMVQVQHQLAVTGAKMGSVAALVGGVEFLWCDIERDEVFIDLLRKVEGQFWQSLIDKIEPAVDGSDHTRKTLAALYARDTGEIVALPPEAIEWDNERLALKEQIEKLEERAQEIDNKFKAAIKDASAAELPNGVIYTYKLQTAKEYTVASKTYRVMRRKGSPR